MNQFFQSVLNVFRGGLRAFLRYPASMVCALVIAAAASVRLALDGDSEVEHLLICIQWAALLGGALGMTATALSSSRRKAGTWMAVGNGVALLVAAGLAVWLHLGYGALPALVTSRVVAGAVLGFLLFQLILSRQEMDIEYGEIWFVTLRSFFIAAIYTAVLLGGLSFIVFAVENLLLDNLDEKVYAHVAVWSLFAGYAFFLGYLPTFSPEDPGDRLETTRRHPVFIEVLLAYVVIPLFALMTLVLLIWSVRILALGEMPAFSRIAAIFSSYAVVGIGVAILTGRYRQLTAVWFRRLFPVAAIVFLAFETYAIVDEVSRNGLRTGSYVAILIGVYALLGAIILMLRPLELHRLTGWIAMVIVLVAVLPFVSYLDLPARSQGNRMAKVLERNQMLVQDRIRPAATALAAGDREDIIVAAEYFYYDAREAPKPAWLAASLDDMMQFETVFGFSPFDSGEGPAKPPVSKALYLTLPQGSSPITGYDLAVTLGELWGNPPPVPIEGKQGVYAISLSGFTRNGTPRIHVEREGQPLPDPDLMTPLRALVDKYNDGTFDKQQVASYEDMLIPLETDGVRMLLVLQSVEVLVPTDGEPTDWFLAVAALYFGD